MKRIIQSKEAPQAVGPYSQAVSTGGLRLLYTAGQIAIDPQSGEAAGGGIADQTIRVLENLKAVLKAGGSDLSRVIKTTVFLKNMNDFAVINEVYGRYFPRNPPARSTVEVARLPKDVLIEIECIAETDAE